jgi:hypothetical protein
MDIFNTVSKREDEREKLKRKRWWKENAEAKFYEICSRQESRGKKKIVFFPEKSFGHVSIKVLMLSDYLALPKGYIT